MAGGFPSLGSSDSGSCERVGASRLTGTQRKTERVWDKNTHGDTSLHLQSAPAFILRELLIRATNTYSANMGPRLHSYTHLDEVGIKVMEARTVQFDNVLQFLKSIRALRGSPHRLTEELRWRYTL